MPMTRLILIATVFMLLSGPAAAVDSKVVWTPIGNKSCQLYPGAYSRTTLTGAGKESGPRNLSRHQGGSLDISAHTIA